MNMHKNKSKSLLLALVGLALLATDLTAHAGRPIDPDKRRIVDHWTRDRKAAAIPRELRVDERGLAYLLQPDGSLRPHGHSRPALRRAKDATPSPFGRTTSRGDTQGPTVTGLTPAAGTEIGDTATFSATVTDASGVRSVTISVQNSGGTVWSFSAGKSGDVWSAGIKGFSDGAWQWRVTATDGSRNRNTTVSNWTPITVATGGGTGGSGGGTGDSGGSGGSGGTGDLVTNSHWDLGGKIARAAGRIYFEMPSSYSRRRGYTWSGYVCSGTVVTDGVTGRSMILTAAHCAYDDNYKMFARNVLFIPNQDDGGSDKTDRNCSNDPIGCWTPAFAVVHTSWTQSKFPANIPWDYAFYVFDDAGAHQGNGTEDALEVAAPPMTIDFGAPVLGDYTHALGYSYSDDPYFMYCAQGVTTESSYNDLWLGSCGLSGGASGGPWVQPLVDGNGPIISVNSWGYTTQPGMAGPRLSTGSAQCVYNEATSRASQPSLPSSGIVAACP